MNYDKYLKLCREKYKADMGLEILPSLNDFYDDPVVRVPIESFSDTYMESILAVKDRIKKYFDENPNSPMAEYPDIFDFETELLNISNELVGWLESERYGCHLYVDKIYIYRTYPLEERVSSYIWHYDNNPEEVVKNIIYLTDVTEKNSPFEYLMDKDGRGVLFESTRRGTEMWKPVANNSRLVDEVKYLFANGYTSKKVIGSIGTTTSFNNDAGHRVNPILEGYRDVINIRVKPTLKKAPKYIGKKYTTGFEVSGAVNQNPELSWSELV